MRLTVGQNYATASYISAIEHSLKQHSVTNLVLTQVRQRVCGLLTRIGTIPLVAQHGICRMRRTLEHVVGLVGFACSADAVMSLRVS